MSWKKTLPFFAWQSLKFARDLPHFKKIWSCYPEWTASFQSGRNSVSDERPWLNFPAVEFLENAIKPGDRVFEFGGGGSTLFFCKKKTEVYTVEDNADWFEILSEMVKKRGYTQWNGYFQSPEQYAGTNTQRRPDNPADFMSGSRGLGAMTFEKYARTIDTFPDAFFDVVLVDGRARPSCFRQAIPKIKPGGLVVVDNTERAYYLSPFEEEIRSGFRVEYDRYAPVAYTPDFTKTTILRKL